MTCEHVIFTMCNTPLRRRKTTLARNLLRRCSHIPLRVFYLTDSERYKEIVRGVDMQGFCERKLPLKSKKEKLALKSKKEKLALKSKKEKKISTKKKQKSSVHVFQAY